MIRRAGRKKLTNPSLMTFLLSAHPMLSPCGRPPSYSPTLAGPGKVPRPALPDTLPSSCALSLTTRPPPTALLGSLSCWPEEPCPLPLLPLLASVGLLLSPSPQGGSGALLSVTSFAASSHEAWRSSMPRPSKKRAARISLLCLLALAPTRLRTPLLLQPSLSPLMGQEPLTRLPCCVACSLSLAPMFACLSCVSSTPPGLSLCGMTLMASPHAVFQAEGGEQGDPLMPALHALGQRPALAEVQGSLRLGEPLLSFLDDTNFVVQPECVRPVLDLLAAALWRHARIQLSHAKIRQGPNLQFSSLIWLVVCPLAVVVVSSALLVWSLMLLCVSVLSFF